MYGKKGFLSVFPCKEIRPCGHRIRAFPKTSIRFGIVLFKENKIFQP